MAGWFEDNYGNGGGNGGDVFHNDWSFDMSEDKIIYLVKLLSKNQTTAKIFRKRNDR